MTEQTNQINTARVLTLLEAYGGSPDAWPSEERSAALQLISQSAELRQAQHEALQLDRVLGETSTAKAHDEIATAALANRIMAQLPDQDRSGRVKVAHAAEKTSLLEHLQQWLRPPAIATAAMAGLVMFVALQFYLPPQSATPDIAAISAFEDWAWEETTGQTLSANDESAAWDMMDLLGVGDFSDVVSDGEDV